MTLQEAKDILAAYRPGTEDEKDPMFAEALAMVRGNPELAAWLEESLAFDKVVRGEVAQVRAPETLLAEILTSRKVVKVAWWNRRLSAPQWAAAAAVLFLAASAVLWASQKPKSFADFRREVAEQSWGSTPHLQVRATNVADIRKALAAEGAPHDFHLPSTLEESSVQGYSLVRWRGKEVPLVCFHSEGQHLHLVIADKKSFPDAPTTLPEVDQWLAWRTASWSKNDFTYVLTGLKTQSFVKKFRKTKRWDWEG
jgi:hypothetical protein